ncbi:MAG: hypothetical protein M3081_14510 [Gemmatimonadota bacterium]|nr:hypothetical protein [Gemmatimonadota bacterium]
MPTNKAKVDANDQAPVTEGTSRQDAIRIVPLKAPAGTRQAVVARATPPLLTYRGGPLLTAVDVAAIFWGGTWSTNAAQKKLTTQISDFFTYVVTSPLIDQLSEYNVPNYRIAHGAYRGAVVVSTPVPGATVTDTAIRRFLLQQISGNPQVAKPTPNRLYFVYLPPGTSVVQGGTRSCQAFCGYHDAIPDPTHGEIFYAVMPYPGCAGCRGTLSLIDALTSTSSHELCEAITDPIPGQSWYDDHNGEIGDICAWKTRSIGGHVVQLEWSNAAKKCI